MVYSVQTLVETSSVSGPDTDPLMAGLPRCWTQHRTPKGWAVLILTLVRPLPPDPPWSRLYSQRDTPPPRRLRTLRAPPPRRLRTQHAPPPRRLRTQHAPPPCRLHTQQRDAETSSNALHPPIRVSEALRATDSKCHGPGSSLCLVSPRQSDLVSNRLS